MGFYKNQLIDEQENVRDCPECGERVRVNWTSSPNFECTNCEYVGDLAQCERCTNLVQNDEVLCDDCLDYLNDEYE